MTDEWAGKIAVVIIKRKQIAGAMLNIIMILKRVVQENREPIKFYFEKVGESDAN